MEDLRRAWELAYCGSLALPGEDPGKGSHDRETPEGPRIGDEMPSGPRI